MRVYQGGLSRGDSIVNTRTGQKVRVARLGRMHASELQVKTMLSFSPKSPGFMCLQYKCFENTVGKGEIAHN